MLIKTVIKLVSLHNRVCWMVIENKVRWIRWDKISEDLKSHTV